MIVRSTLVRRRTASACLVLALAALPGTARMTAQGLRATLSPVVESASVHAGTTVRAALVVHLPPGYHAQSNTPRDPSAIATRLTFDAPPGVSVLEEVFPPTTDVRLVGFDDPQPVFERDFVIGVQFAIAKDAALGPTSVVGHFRYQACNDRQCLVPVSLTSSWALSVVSAAAPVSKSGDAVFAGVAFGHGTLPPPSIASDRAVRPAASLPRPNDLSALARLDAFDLRGQSTGYSRPAQFVQFIHDAESGVAARGLFDGRGPLTIIVIVFVGGLALNLTPCVLPMIPINLAIIGAGARAGRKRRGLLLGATYGAAMALAYGVLGLVVILTAGTFGAINASPWFNLGIAALFVVLGLAMFDVVTVDFSRFSSGIHFKAESRGTLLLAFGMGTVAALLAGACVAPVVVEVVLFSSNLYATGTPIALALPFVLGLGMALPWPAAGAGLSLLPKPGRWMERVKYVFGAFILATAAYYGYEAFSLFSNRWVDPASVRAGVEEQIKAGWQPSLSDGLDESIRTGRPVLIDMWATWCKNCLVMDKTTLVDPAVRAALAGYVKIKFDAEDADVSPAKDLVQRFGSVGLPTYAILKPKSSAK